MLVHAVAELYHRSIAASQSIFRQKPSIARRARVLIGSIEWVRLDGSDRRIAPYASRLFATVACAGTNLAQSPFRYYNSSPEVIRLAVLIDVRFHCRCGT